ncbi:MAG: helix-turn-helix transcriptional regulator [Lachnospiraceae bacterium]|nr:helix-turn-helix transcriptional regulator [Lachnospiraceae bacterium]
MANVGKTIKVLRIRKGMTQDEMAEKLFISRQTVSNYENGKSNPDLDILVKIADMLETDANTLIYGEREKEDKKKKIIRWIILAVIFAVLFFIVIMLEKELKYFMTRYYIVWPRLILRAWGFPLIFGFASWLFMDAVFIAFDIKRKESRKAVWIHWIAVGIVIAYFLCILPVTIDGVTETYRWYVARTLRQDHSSSINYSGWLTNKVLLWMFYVSLSKCMVFAVPGAVIRATKCRIKKEDIQDA